MPRRLACAVVLTLMVSGPASAGTITGQVVLRGPAEGETRVRPAQTVIWLEAILEKSERDLARGPQARAVRPAPSAPHAQAGAGRGSLPAARRHRGRRRVAAMEILVFTTAIAHLVREGKTHQIPGIVQVGKKLGNQPLDDAIMEHLRMKRISPEEAYDKCLDKKKFRTFLSTPPDEDEI